MKKIITLLALLMLVSCTKTIEEKQADWNKCADKTVTALNKKYESMGQQKGQEAFLNDFCKFQRMEREQCGMAIMMSSLEGTWPNVVNDYTYRAVLVPACGEFPIEDKKPKNK